MEAQIVPTLEEAIERDRSNLVLKNIDHIAVDGDSRAYGWCGCPVWCEKTLQYTISPQDSHVVWYLGKVHPDEAGRIVPFPPKKEPQEPANRDAPGLLRDAAEVLAERGRQRDSEQGERSMAMCVSAFNTLTGHDISETDGWKFMMILKLSRMAQGGFNEDDYVDAIGYSALMAESALKHEGNV